MGIVKQLRLVHIASTSWFITSACYILVLALHEAGKSWWVIVSLSGYSTLLAFLLISLYLFAIFRGVARSQKIQVEHPLTSTRYYMGLYVIAPFLGGLAGMLGMIGEDRLSQFVLGIALGSLWATFLVWIVVDPVAGFLEMLLPPSRKHRLERLATLREWREQREKNRKRLLAAAHNQDRKERRQWKRILEPYAEKLAAVLVNGQCGPKAAEEEAVKIGVRAWQIGGLSCMRELHSMTTEFCKTQHKDFTIIDYLPFWWDGIGSWRTPSVV